jgi:four helix bundle protein
LANGNRTSQKRVSLNRERFAKGFERASRKEYLLFLNFAKGSAEVRSLLRVALEIGCLEVETYELLREDALKLSAYLFNHIKAIRRSQLKS